MRSLGRRSRRSERGDTTFSCVESSTSTSTSRAVSIWKVILLLWNVYLLVNDFQPRIATKTILEMLDDGRHCRLCRKCHHSCCRGCEGQGSYIGRLTWYICYWNSHIGTGHYLCRWPTHVAEMNDYLPPIYTRFSDRGDYHDGITGNGTFR